MTSHFITVLLFLLNFDQCEVYFVRYQESNACLLPGPICLQYSFPSFTLWWFISSELLCVSQRQPIDRFCLLTHLVSSCLLIGGLRPLLFKVIIERSHLISVIMLLISGVIVYILSGTILIIIASYSFPSVSWLFFYSSLHPEIVLPIFSLDLVCWI